MYQVLARKYRPRNFIELVGQNHVSRALTSALERGRLHHAYLFTGTRGVGKTTIARILAKCLNCETGVTSTPCEVCATCTAVNEGRFIDLIEIDAASRTKVEDTRELLDNVPYAPTQGRYKVYLIDEVHMLSTHSFNALLKTLEEPPEHVKFLFATTDPQKLPITVISRCLQFTLRPLAIDEITAHLGHILNQEDIKAEQDAIWQIAESAQGSLRDALSLTDQAIAYGQGSIQHQDVKEMLGLIDRTIIFDLILAIHQNQQQHVSALLMQFRQQALDVSLVLDQLISTLHELALLQYLPELSLKYSAEINAKIMQLSTIISAQDLQLYYQVASKGRAELQLAVTQEQGFEMCILRLLAFRPLQANEIALQQPSLSSTQANSELAQQSESTHAVTQAEFADTDPLNDPLVKHEVERKTLVTQALIESQSEFDTNPAQSVQSVASTQQSHLSQQHATSKLDDESEHDFDHAVVNHTNQVLEPTGDDDLDAAQLKQSASDALQAVDPTNHPVEDLVENPVDNKVLSNANEANVFANQDLLNTTVTEQNASNLVSRSVTDQNQIVENAATTIQDREAPALSFFGGEPALEVASLITAVQSDQEVFFLNPEDVKDITNNTNLALSEAKPISVELVNSKLALSKAQDIDANKPLLSSSSKQGLMPQDILALNVQNVEGEWDVDKWEYWFRNSDLSPAIQELAQQGVMTGRIDGESCFLIPVKYESILTQFQQTLENALLQRWSNTQFNVRYQEVLQETPFAKQAERKMRAYSRANELLTDEDAVKGLMALFDAEIHNIQLK